MKSCSPVSVGFLLSFHFFPKPTPLHSPFLLQIDPFMLTDSSSSFLSCRYLDLVHPTTIVRVDVSTGLL
ncbi:hypothetical protein ACLOJK_023581 [Asimina triloba]